MELGDSPVSHKYDIAITFAFPKTMKMNKPAISGVISESPNYLMLVMMVLFRDTVLLIRVHCFLALNRVIWLNLGKMFLIFGFVSLNKYQGCWKRGMRVGINMT